MNTYIGNQKVKIYLDGIEYRLNLPIADIDTQYSTVQDSSEPLSNDD